MDELEFEVNRNEVDEAPILKRKKGSKPKKAKKLCKIIKVPIIPNSKLISFIKVSLLGPNSYRKKNNTILIFSERRWLKTIKKR